MMLPVSVPSKSSLSSVSLVRNSSMLLTIENILSSSSSSSSRSPVQAPHPSPDNETITQGVYAAEPLKMGLLSREFNSSQLMTVKRTPKMSVKLVNGVLESSNGYQWLRNIRFSENIYSQNAVFEMTRAGNIRIRTIKSVSKEEEIIAWFTDELALFMSINFLSPYNIKGLHFSQNVFNIKLTGNSPSRKQLLHVPHLRKVLPVAQPIKNSHCNSMRKTDP